MRSKTSILGNFTRAIFSESPCIRPGTEEELLAYLKREMPRDILARGAGLSYSDSCFNSDHLIIDTQFFNHFIDFDESSGIVVCQGGMPLSDLFLLHPHYIPAVVPGTIHATVASCVAHDVHGKNNHREGSFGQHVLWMEIIVANQLLRCSPNQHSDLFYASIGGLGLTGIITRVALQLKRTSRLIHIENKTFESIQALTQNMSTNGVNYDYQVAWIDLLNTSPRAIHCMANHGLGELKEKNHKHRIQKFPFRLIYQWNMSLFNKLYFNDVKPNESKSFIRFNNPLDSIKDWNKLYGSKGLIQFQALVNQESMDEIFKQLLKIMRQHKATPTLAVLKLFIKPGLGLLSFCKPGFTLAIDFINNPQAKAAISHMNQLITEAKGRVYLAKDQLINKEQFRSMYDKHEEFSGLLKSYDCNMRSDLAMRVGLLS